MPRADGEQLNWREQMPLLGAGALGGLLSWLWAFLQALPETRPPISFLLAYIPLGMGAAFIGIYVIANSDTRSFKRCLGFALLCGFSWKGVYEGGSLLVKQSAARSQVISQTETLAQATTELAAATADERGEKTGEVARTTIKLLNSLPTVDDPAIESVAERKVKDSLDAIAKVNTDSPDEAADAILGVGRAGATAQKLWVTDTAVMSLQRLGKEDAASELMELSEVSRAL